MNTPKSWFLHSRALPGVLFALVLMAAGTFAACEWLDYPLEKYHAEQTGTLAVQDVLPVEDGVALGTDGVVCVAPGTTTITIPLDNPLGYAVREAGLITFPVEPPGGVAAAARQSADKNAIEITITGAAAGAGFPINLSVKTAKEGRLLASQTLTVACVDFETRLSALSVTGPAFDFSPDLEGYAINDIPSPQVTILYTPINAASTVSISGAGPAGDLMVTGNTVALAVGTTAVTVRVEAAHGAAAREYKLYLTRNQAGSSKSITSFTLAGRPGIIDEAAGTIAVTVPYGTDLTSITPDFTHTGDSVDPAKGTAQDFSSPVLYTVRPGDTSAPKTYTVRAAAAELNSIAITTPPVKTEYTTGESLDTAGWGVSGIDALGISLDVTSDCTLETSAFKTPGTKYITVTHTPSGKTTILTVMVSNSAKEITSFMLAGRPGTITNTGDTTGTIGVTVPYGTNMASLAPDFYHTGVSVDYPSGAARDFSGPVTYVVRAQDGSTRTYTVTATEAKIAAVTGVSGYDTGGYKRTGSDISGTIKNDLTVTGVDSSGTLVTILSGDYSLSPVNPASITGTGRDATVELTVPGAKTSAGTDKTFYFPVYIKSDDTRLSNLSLSADNTPVPVSPVYVAGTLVGYEAELTAPITAGAPVALTVNAVIADTRAAVEVNNNNSPTHNFSSSRTDIPVTVTAEDGTYDTYSVKVYTIPAAPVGFDLSDVYFDGDDLYIYPNGGPGNGFQINGAQSYDIFTVTGDFSSWGLSNPDDIDDDAVFVFENKNLSVTFISGEEHKFLDHFVTWVRGKTDDGKEGAWSNIVVPW